jgi:hypothetical protein
LNTGEDLIAQVNDISNGRIFMSNPLKVLYTPSINTGYLAISLMQWVFTRISSKQDFDMDISHIIIMVEPDQKLQDHYKSSVSTFENTVDVTDDDTEYGAVEENEGLEMLRNLLGKIKDNKGKLH